MGISAGKEPGNREPTPVYMPQPYQRGAKGEDTGSHYPMPASKKGKGHM